MVDNIVWYAPQIALFMVGLLLANIVLEIVRITRPKKYTARAAKAKRSHMKKINFQYIPQMVYPEVTVKTGDTAVIMRGQDKALNRLVLSLVRKASN